MSAGGLLVRKLLISGNCWSESFTWKRKLMITRAKISNLCAYFSMLILVGLFVVTVVLNNIQLSNLPLN